MIFCAAFHLTKITMHWEELFTRRGFTGHEHYPQLKIINMNGRLYDPVIGRFFSPDKYVANGTFTQDFNRYSYARNNPLMYTDPDGEFIWIPIVVGVAVAAITYTAQVATSEGGFRNWDWGHFVFSVGMGAFSGAATWGIGSAFGAVGSTLLGSSLLNEVGRAGMHALTQGTISLASGGNFWQGVATGFAVSAFNHAMDAGLEKEIEKQKILEQLKEMYQSGKLEESIKNGTLATTLGTTMWGEAAKTALKEAGSADEFIKNLKSISKWSI